jgi:hypothetical protein
VAIPAPREFAAITGATASEKKLDLMRGSSLRFFVRSPSDPDHVRNGLRLSELDQGHGDRQDEGRSAERNKDAPALTATADIDHCLVQKSAHVESPASLSVQGMCHRTSGSK